MNSESTRATQQRPRPWRNILRYGLCGGVLITLLKLTECRFLVVEHSLEIYGGLVAAIFSALGICLGITHTRIKAASRPARESNPFEPDEQRILELNITPRELEILGLIAAGLSNRESSRPRKREIRGDSCRFARYRGVSLQFRLMRYCLSVGSAS